MIITIDGPSGTGKSTIARLVAKRCGYAFLDTGALYRAFGYACLQAGIDVQQEEALQQLLSSITLVLKDNRLFLNNQDVSDLIRTSEVAQAASLVATYPSVRHYLLPIQRSCAHEDLVCEGRDMGSVVFPEAQVKIFLTASLEERARRRHKELGKGTLSQVMKDLSVRDARDSSRAEAPLIIPQGALEIDTTNMTIEDVVTTICSMVHR